MPFSDTTPLQVEETVSGNWEVLAPLNYDGAQQPMSVPEHYVTNFGSIPKPLGWLVPKFGREYTRPFVLHDYLCERGWQLVPPVHRNDADGILRRSLGELGVPTVRRYIIWGAVRLASRFKDASTIDWFGLVWIALIALLVAFVGFLGVLPALLLLFLVELIVWLLLRAFGKKPRAGFLKFWWA